MYDPSVPGCLLYPEPGKIRARLIVGRSNYDHVDKFANAKNRRILEFESGLESDRAILLELDLEEVSLFRTIPEIIACFRIGKFV
jgi:hypothetical protein